MKTVVAKLGTENNKEIIGNAAKIIKTGGLVVFPTETVYGLGASVFDEAALKKIFSAKGRPADNPLIVHISNQNQLKELTDIISPMQQKLMDKFWPGPLTILFAKKDSISSIVSGGLNTIAVRMPLHGIAQALISEASSPIAAPSANISGRPSGTTAEDVLKDLIGKVDMIIDAGQSDIGVESTVVKVGEDSVSILRPGAITKEMIENIVSPLPVISAKDKKDLQSSPGTQYPHYSPNAKLFLEISSKVEERAASLQKEGKKVGIICTNQTKFFFKSYEPNVFTLGGENNLEEISRSLYSALRFFDVNKVDVIVCPTFPKEGIGAAIMDRLERATGE